jgi:hypothetical protein
MVPHLRLYTVSSGMLIEVAEFAELASTIIPEIGGALDRLKDM